MIDIEALQFSRVKTAVVAAYPACTCNTTDNSSTAPKFPYLQLSQEDDPIYEKTIDSGNKENHVKPMMQLDAYTTTTMLDCKKIFAVADSKMQADGWTRTFGPQPLSKVSPFRLTARYQAVVEQTGANSYMVYGN